MKKALSILAALAAAFFFCQPASALSVSLGRAGLSLEARNEPLQDVLESIAQTGVRVRVDPAINPRVSASFKDRDVESALRSLLKGQNYALVWESVPAKSAKTVRLSEIQIFEPGRKSAMRLLVSRRVSGVGTDPKTGALFVKDELLIRFKPGLSQAAVEKILALAGGVILEHDPATGICRVLLPPGSDVPGAVAALANVPGVAGVEPNYAFAMPSPGTALAAQSKALALSWAPDGTAAVAVLDSGLDLSAMQGAQIVAALDAVNPGSPISDSLGHGTQMALIASGGIRPEGASADYSLANPVIAIRAFDENGLASSYTLMEGLEFALQNGAAVINMSWGTPADSAFLRESLEKAANAGAVLVAAAGNEPTADKVFPAAYGFVLSVGALAPDGSLWESSSQGDYVKVAAPGFAELPVGYGAGPGTYAGTSISSAFVSAVLAAELSKNPQATKTQLLQALARYF